MLNVQNSRVAVGDLARCLVIAVSCFLASGCVYTPEEGDWVDWDDLDFAGFAEKPGAVIQIQAYNNRDSRWVTVDSVVSSSSGTHYGDTTLYSWSNYGFDFTTVPQWQCYWSTLAGCSIPAGFASARFRFKEVGSALSYLVTFDPGGISCVVSEVNGGSTWLAAGATCRGDKSPVLTLRRLT